MIRDLAAAVSADLAARRFPYPTTYGPELIGRDGFKPAIIFQRDRAAGDAVEPPLGATRPRAGKAEAPFLRRVAGSFTVYARSSRPAATVADHEDECDRVCDGVLTALYRTLKAKCLPLAIVDSRLLTRDELRAAAEAGQQLSAADDHSGRRSADWPGCAARVRFTVATLVRDVDYTGAGPELGTITEFAAPEFTGAGYESNNPPPDEEDEDEEP